MKKGAIWIAAVLVLCAVALAACGMDDARNETTTTSTVRDESNRTSTTERRMDDMIREDGETVSEMFSEGFSEMRDSGFLDPDNGMIVPSVEKSRLKTFQL